MPNALTSIATALLLDLADLITFGAVGVWTGFLLGAVLGWTLAPQLGFPERRWLPALFGGAYCMLPGTALMPLAAIFTGVRSFAANAERATGERGVDPPARRAEPGAIEADYQASWEERPGDREARPRD
jgi:hypothetical protein